jgi:UPF0271 protein
MGEGFPNDAAIIPFISSVNIACGYHAGDEDIMQQTILLAMQHHVAIGAHPSYPDRENFGRKQMDLPPKSIYELVHEQVKLLKRLAEKHGATLHHVKPHGALYNAAAVDGLLAVAICEAIKSIDTRLILYGLSGSEFTKAAKKTGLSFASEIFADRTYQDNGSLTPRTAANALVEDVNLSVERILEMVVHEKTTTTSGKTIALSADTVCIHGDGKHAALFAEKISLLLNQNGIDVAAPAGFIR